MRLYQVLTPEDSAKILKQVAPLKWGTGKARTKELTGTVKQNQEILVKDDKVASSLLTAIGQRIMSHGQIGLECIPLGLHTPKFSKYVKGAKYHEHTDAPWMGDTRTDISFTLWLSPPESYEGGELNLNGKKVKGKAGQALFYDCGEIHSVSPVTKGERICVVSWIQSRIRDPIKRKMITDFRKWLAKMEGTELFAEGSPIYSALLKRWME